MLQFFKLNVIKKRCYLAMFACNPLSRSVPKVILVYSGPRPTLHLSFVVIC